MIDYKALVDYFENLATINEDLKHLPGVKGRECFLEGDVFELFDDIGGFTSGTFTMLVETGSGQFTGNNRNNAIDNADVAFSIVHPVALHDRDEGRKVLQQCKNIAMEICRRMIYDDDNGHAIMQDFDLTNVRYMRLSGLPDNRMGIRCEFDVKGSMNPQVTVAKWSDL